MKDQFRTFLLSKKDKLWHWRNECSGYPAANEFNILFSIGFPADKELCKTCSKIESDNGPKKRMTMII